MNGLNRLGTGVKIGLGFGVAGLLVLVLFSQFHRLFSPHASHPRAAMARHTAAPASLQPAIQRLQTLAGQLEQSGSGAALPRDFTTLNQAADRLEARLGSIDLDRIRTLVSALRLAQYTYLFQAERRFRDHYHRLLAELKRSLNNAVLDSELWENLRKSIVTYEAAFSGFLAEDRSLANGGPALARLNRAGEALTDAVERRHIPHAGEELLNARRHSAGFFLDGDPGQAKAFETALGDIVNYLKFTRIPDAEQRRIRADIDHYRQTFRRLAAQSPASRKGGGEAARSLRTLAAELKSAEKSAIARSHQAVAPYPAEEEGLWSKRKSSALLFIVGILAIGAGIAWLVAQMVVAPWRNMAAALEDMDSGYSIDLTQRLADSGDRETGPVVEGVNRILDSVAEVVRQARGNIQDLSQGAAASKEAEAALARLLTATGEVERLRDRYEKLTGQASLLTVNAAIQATAAGEDDPAYAAVADNAETLLDSLKEANAALAQQTGALQTLAGETRERGEQLSQRHQETLATCGDLQRVLQRLRV